MASLDDVFPEFRKEFKDMETRKQNNICPICHQRAKMVCHCILQDRKCVNGHSWHIRNSKRVLGPAGH